MASFSAVANKDQIIVSKAALDAQQKEILRLRKLVETPQVSPDNAEIQRLQDEIIQLKAAKATVRMVSGDMKVTDKGGISVYGLGRFPVTLYRDQWIKLLDGTADIQEFIEAHKGELKKKGE
jgi:hypothetical protein